MEREPSAAFPKFVPEFSQTQLAVDDPDLIAAVADVDRSQIRDNLRRSPAERLQAAFSMAEALRGFRRVAG
jgi:hypothetical protein